MSISLLTLGAVLVVSLVSLVGILALSLNHALLRRALSVLVGLAAGTLIGDAFIHLIPESLEALSSERVFGAAVIAGILMFFVLEKYLRWHHAHHGEEAEHEGHERYEKGSHAPSPHLAPLVLVADALHNLLDGVIIAASFLLSPAVGFATAIAVFLHEIPQEIADYALLVHAGLSRGKALFFNFLSALTAFAGAALTLLLSQSFESYIPVATAVTAGAFIYIAIADVVPELHKTSERRTSFIQFFSIVAGVAVMLALTLLE